MNDRFLPFVRRSFWPLLILGVADRFLLLCLFGFKYVGDDDGLIWSAAVDYAHGLFREPYFYGQDYAVMLEALVAAPFTYLGIPLNFLMPTVTSCLALLPYWSFAFWHRKQNRPLAALLFLAMPALLPVEYGMMTTITRCFITGIAPLAALPWITPMRGHRLRSFLLGLVVSCAAFINPNGIFFGVPFVIFQLLSNGQRWRSALFCSLGTVPFSIAHFAARAYCNAHPERMVHVAYDWRMTFHPGELIPESLGMLDTHFAWLFPVLSSYGELIFFTLVLLAATAAWRKQWALSGSLGVAWLLILLSFAFPKTHDGTDGVFFPYSRMYLAMPLLCTWGLAAIRIRSRHAGTVGIALLVLCTGTVLLKARTTPLGIEQQLSMSTTIVHEEPVARMEADALALRDLCDSLNVDLLLASTDWPNSVAPQFRCYLHTVLQPSLPPTYLFGSERRYWQRDAFAEQAIQNILAVGGDSAGWARCMLHEPRWLDVSPNVNDQFHLLRNNTEPTDSLLARVVFRYRE